MTTLTLNGTPIHTVGTLPAVGTQAPDFTMTREDLTEIYLHDCLGKKTILNIFPSIDTPTCAKAVKHFNEIVDGHTNLLMLCVSADLPFAQKRFCSIENLKKVIPVSIFRHTDFGKTYGVQIIDGPIAGLLSRAVVVIDEHGKIIHTEQVKELADEPNYQAVLACINSP